MRQSIPVQRSPAAERPLGMTILAAVVFAAGVFGTFASLAIIGLGDLDVDSGRAATAMTGLPLRIVGAALMIGSAFLFAFAWGAWHLRAWGWWLGLVLNGLGALADLSIAFRLHAPAVSLVLGGAIHLAIVVYLLTPHVRRAFEPDRSAP